MQFEAILDSITPHPSWTHAVFRVKTHVDEFGLDRFVFVVIPVCLFNETLRTGDTYLISVERRDA